MSVTKGELVRSVVRNLRVVINKYLSKTEVHVVPLTMGNYSQNSSGCGSIGQLEIGRGKARIILDSDDLVALGVVIDISNRDVRGSRSNDFWHIKAFAVSQDGKTVRSCYYLLDGKLKDMDLVSCVTCALKDLEDLQKFNYALYELTGDSVRLANITVVQGYCRGEEMGTCL